MAVLHYNFHTHPKITGLSLATVGVFALALSYCSANLTDGFIPEEAARKIDPKKRHFDRLVEAGLLTRGIPNGGQTAAKRRPDFHRYESQMARGYVVTDYLDYNPTKTEVEAKRSEAKERMKRVRANKGAKKPAGSREQKRDVRLNVHDIGKDNPLKSKAKATSTDVTSTADGDEVAAKRAELEAAAKFAGVKTIGGGLEAFLEHFHEEAASG